MDIIPKTFPKFSASFFLILFIWNFYYLITDEEGNKHRKHRINFFVLILQGKTWVLCTIVKEDNKAMHDVYETFLMLTYFNANQ